MLIQYPDMFNFFYHADFVRSPSNPRRSSSWIRFNINARLTVYPWHPMAWDFWKSATAEVFWHWSWSKHQRAALLSLLSLAMFGSLYPYVCWSNPPSYFSGSNQVPRSLHEFPWLLLFSPIFANISRFFPTFQWTAFHQQTVSTLSRACWPQARHQRVESVRDWRNRLSDLQHLGPRNRRCISWSNEQSALQRGFGLADVKLKWPQDGSDGVPRIVKLWCWRQLGLLLLNFLWAPDASLKRLRGFIGRWQVKKAT